MKLFLEGAQAEIGINAVADFAAGDVFSDVVSLKNHGRVVFITHWGVGTTGVVNLTVQACDDVTPSNTAAVPFHYRINANGTHGALTAATADGGVSNVAGSNQVIMCEIDTANLLASGYSYARLSVNETTDAALLGGVIVLLLDPIHSRTTPLTGLT